MRVGIDITYAAKQEGTGTYIRHLLNELARHPDVEWVTFARPRPALLRRLPRPVSRLLNGLLSLGWMQLIVPIQARRRRIDLFHAPAFVAPLLLHCPLVVTLHDAYQYMLKEQRDRLWSLYVRAVATIAVRRSARVITMSRAAGEDVERFFGVPVDKLRVTYLGVSPAFRRLPAAAAAVLLPMGVAEPFLLFVGAGDARKNYGGLLGALRLLHERGLAPPPLVVTGNPTAEFRQLAEAPAIREVLRIHWVGFVPEAVLVALYNRAAAFVFPSRYEGFGLPALEAMACGCPVVCGNTSALPEVVGDAAVLVDPDDVGALAGAIAALLTDPAVAERLRARGFTRSAQLSWSATAEATVAVYREVCYTSGRH